MKDDKELFGIFILIGIIGIYLIGDGLVGVITRRMAGRYTAFIGAEAVNTGFIQICGGALFVYTAYKLYRWNTDDDDE